MNYASIDFQFNIITHNRNEWIQILENGKLNKEQNNSSITWKHCGYYFTSMVKFIVDIEGYWQ